MEEYLPGNIAPRILARSEHIISRRNIDADALKVLYRLRSNGFVAYLVGGGVRDLLLERAPKDFDISTSAHPAQVKKLFRNCFIVGRRFRLAHVRFGKKVIEVSTFRRAAEPEEGDTLIRRDNTFGTPEEDAFRRDFTVNALFYDIATFSVIDWVRGLTDLEARVIRSIGDPGLRFREDPVRMLRAVALASRLGFTIDRDSEEAIRALRGEIVRSSPARVLEEIYKILRQGRARETFGELHRHGLLAYLLPEAAKALDGRRHRAARQPGPARPPPRERSARGRAHQPPAHRYRARAPRRPAAARGRNASEAPTRGRGAGGRSGGRGGGGRGPGCGRGRRGRPPATGGRTRRPAAAGQRTLVPALGPTRPRPAAGDPPRPAAARRRSIARRRSSRSWAAGPTSRKPCGSWRSTAARPLRPWSRTGAASTCRMCPSLSPHGRGGERSAPARKPALRDPATPRETPPDGAVAAPSGPRRRRRRRRRRPGPPAAPAA